MKKLLLIICILFLFLACESKEKNKNKDSFVIAPEKIKNESPVSAKNGELKEEDPYTFDKFKQEFKETINNIATPIGTYFWDEYKDLEEQYGMTNDESKLLGRWLNVNYIRNPNNYYFFYPNKLFLLMFYPQHNYHYNNGDNLHFNQAIGTWDVVEGIVQFTIYAFIFEDSSKRLYDKNRKSLSFVEKPYTIDFIRIDDIGEEGFTKRPINETIFSNETKKLVRIEESKSIAELIDHSLINNLYMRNIYSIHYVTNSGRPERSYEYFDIVQDMVNENLSGLDIVTNRELIEKYIFDLW